MDYLYPCMLFVWVAYLWETYLQWRQHCVYKTSTVAPPEVVGMIDQDTFSKSRLYQLDKSFFSLVQNFVKQIEFLVFIVLGAIPYAWSLAGSCVELLGYDPAQDQEIKQAVAFLLVVQVYSTISDIPWSLYSIFVLEEKHGFNKQTIGFFVKDSIKKFLLQAVLNPSIMAGLIFIIKWGGEYFYLYAWVFVLIVSLVMIFIYHDYIAPLFDKYTPLPDGNLKTAIENLASTLTFPLKKLLVVEGSKRSAHSNAYFYGFWKSKCIVLFDTLLEEGILPKTQEGMPSKEKEDVTNKGEEGVATEKGAMLNESKNEVKGCNTDEILAVLAHELGHWKLSHNLKNIVIAEVNLLVILFMFSYFMNQQDLYTSFGFSDSRPILIGFILFLQLIFLPYNEVLSFLLTQLCRRFEYQADAFARELGKASPLKSALTKLHKDNLSFPIADPLYSAFHHSHPTFLERIRVLTDKKQD
ncbi:CAAX prenyl protease 1 homolog [Halichondria panicea]|uniref:CAAX prenyl protease 1 homolog n=1 Tax=Halichondria panicea TaxID=6063 RepID=UPI00312B4F47